MGQIWRSEVLKPSACITLALAFLVLPMRWVLAWITAAAVHEGFHLAAVRLCGGRIAHIRLDADGASITAGELSGFQELLCVLAGPIGALLLLLPLAKRFPATAVCAVFQSAYNLLPLHNLDGGRALRCCAELLFPTRAADRICLVVQWSCLLLITIGALYASVWLNLGLMPLFLAVLLVIKTNFGKIPCKPGRQRVQ